MDNTDVRKLMQSFGKVRIDHICLTSFDNQACQSVTEY